MKFREFLRELQRRNVWKVAVAYTAAAVVLLEVLTHLFHNFEAPHWVLKVITTLLIAGLPLACLAAWGLEVKEGRVRSVPREPQENKPALPTPPTTAPPSIAVLPFEDMSTEQDQKYLGHGIAEELLNALASIAKLKVAARTSSFALAGRGASMQEIGDTLHVRHVLEGSVRRSGQKLRITAQLIDVQSGFNLFSEAYDRSVEDIFDIQNEIAREIVGALLPKLGLGADAKLVKQGTRDPVAYDLWLKAHRWVSNPDPKTFETAIDQLQRAVTLDPSFAEAWGDVAYIYTYSSTWAGDPLPLLMKAYSAAERALSLSPSNVSALLAQAAASMIVHHDAPAAARSYERARVAGVDHSLWAFNKAYLLDGPMGRFDEAITNLADAERRDPMSLPARWLLIEMQLAAGRVAEAVATAERLDALAARVPGSMAYEAYAFLASGDVVRADKILAELRATAGEDFWHVALIEFELWAAIGRREAAQTRLEGLLRMDADGKAVSPFVIGSGYKALGEYAPAIEWWERAVAQRHPHWPQMTARFRSHPVIGKDPRFLALLRRMRLDSDAEAGAA